MDNQYQICTRCVMDNSSDVTIKFQQDGTCNYCTDALARMHSEYFPNETGKQKLDKIMTTIKATCKNDEFDCIVGISGGVDSTYVLYLGYLYGLRMLAIHIDDGLDTPIAMENIKKICAKTETKLVSVLPDTVQYRDITLQTSILLLLKEFIRSTI